jgi:hypothetical protein
LLISLSNILDREKEYKQSMEKMIEHNNQVKSQFENYDEIKNNFYKEIIGDMENNNKNDLNT